MLVVFPFFPPELFLLVLDVPIFQFVARILKDVCMTQVFKSSLAPFSPEHPSFLLRRCHPIFDLFGDPRYMDPDIMHILVKSKKQAQLGMGRAEVTLSPKAPIETQAASPAIYLESPSDP